MREAVNSIASGFGDLFVRGVDPADSRDAINCIREFEALRRMADAATVALLESIDDRGLHIADAHATAKAMVRHHGRLSMSEAAAREKTMKVASTLPNIGRAYRAGEFGTEQIRLLGRVHANPRVRHNMPESQAWFNAQHRHRYADFEKLIRRWERLTDEDGPTPKSQVQHENRNVLLTKDFDGSWSLAGQYGSIQGAQLGEIFEKYVQAELTVDWEKARADLGDDATYDDLDRTPQQRRADAMWQLFQDAASSPAGAVPPGFVHNIVWDADTFEEMASRLLDPDHEQQTLDADTSRCETIDGIDIDPTEAIVSALQSQIRRVLIEAKATVIDLGEARFFTGNSRHAVKLASTTCVWAGCCVPSSQCETDHLTEHTHGGRTNPGNGAPLCGKHNRCKQRGFQIQRQPDGTWLTIRPDGTIIPT